MEAILDVLKALADDNRLKIIELLLDKRYCVRALAGKLGVSESAVSQQLKILRQAGLVRGEKEGYYVHYTVEQEQLEKAGDYLLELGDRQSEDDCCH